MEWEKQRTWSGPTCIVSYLCGFCSLLEVKLFFRKLFQVILLDSREETANQLYWIRGKAGLWLRFCLRSWLLHLPPLSSLPVSFPWWALGSVWMWYHLLKGMCCSAWSQSSRVLPQPLFHLLLFSLLLLFPVLLLLFICFPHFLLFFPQYSCPCFIFHPLHFSFSFVFLSPHFKPNSFLVVLSWISLPSPLMIFSGSSKYYLFITFLKEHVSLIIMNPQGTEVEMKSSVPQYTVVLTGGGNRAQQTCPRAPDTSAWAEHCLFWMALLVLLNRRPFCQLSDHLYQSFEFICYFPFPSPISL